MTDELVASGSAAKEVTETGWGVAAGIREYYKEEVEEVEEVGEVGQVEELVLEPKFIKFCPKWVWMGQFGIRDHHSAVKWRQEAMGMPPGLQNVLI